MKDLLIITAYWTFPIIIAGIIVYIKYKKDKKK